MKRSCGLWGALSAVLVLAPFGAGCGGSKGGAGAEDAADPIAVAERALAEGDARRALSLVSGADPDPARANALLTLKARALIALTQWDEVESLAARIGDAAGKALVVCELKAARRDIGAVKACGDAIAACEAAGQSVWADQARVAQAAGFEADRRYGEAERILKALVATRPTARARRVLVDYYARTGLVPDAVAALEAWRAAEPGAKGLDLKLALLVERQVKGDLLERRGVEALAAARRLRELQPARAEFRYYLADALELTGDAKGAAAERAAAEAAGAKPPRKATDVPGLDMPATPPTAPATAPETRP